MNLLILRPEQLISDDRAIVSGRQLKHMLEVQHFNPGDSLKCGLLNGQMGSGNIISLSTRQAELLLDLNQDPPPPLDISVILALPRPKVLNRTLQTITSLGIKQVILINSFRVNKSYWQSPKLDTQNLEAQCILGLEQACDTILPDIILENRFKPFVEDRLPVLLHNKQGLVAHPVAARSCPISHSEGIPKAIVIGPEGGFIPYEVTLLESAGCTVITLGQRILKVETAITSLITRLSC